MMTTSKPLSASSARQYHQAEFSQAAEQYYTAADTIVGQWHGRLAARFWLTGPVSEEQFARLSEGRHPVTDAVMVAPVTVTPYVNEVGKTITPTAHRAGYDFTVSAPKTISAAALVGGDRRLVQAHRESVRAALDAIEPYTQARHVKEATQNFVVAMFDHDSARPVAGYAAPQLHTHCVVMNVTEHTDHEGQQQMRSIQPKELFRSQVLATAVYRTELARRLTALGYTWSVGASGEPRIDGFTDDYLQAVSPRRAQILKYLATADRVGARAAQIAAHRTRGSKQALTHEAQQALHLDVAASHGNQPQQAVAAAYARGVRVVQDDDGLANVAVDFAKAKEFERTAVTDDRALLIAAIGRSLGRVGVPRLTAEVDRRITNGELLARGAGRGGVTAAYTTPEMVALEQRVINQLMMAPDGQAFVSARVRAAVLEAHPELNAGQRAAVDQVLSGTARVQAIDGVGGSGKTTALVPIREGAEQAGYAVYGLAPTSSAVKTLREDVPNSHTLQRYLTEGRQAAAVGPTLFILDESSLASTRDMDRFLATIQPADRVLLVGDVRQHQSVEAGRIFEQLQAHGMPTAALTEIVRQTPDWYRAAVEKLAAGDTVGAFRDLDTHGKVQEMAHRPTRMAAIAADYIADRAGTLVVAPDHDSRQRINQEIHERLVEQGAVQASRPVAVWDLRQDLTAADRAWAGRYEPGDVIRYQKGSAAVGVQAGTYATVEAVQARAGTVTVRTQAGATVTYDPSRLQGVSVFREAARDFGVGDRVRFTQPFPARRVANGECATVVALSPDTMRVRLDTKAGEGRGRSVGFRLDEYRHLDFGYAITSYTAQSKTDRRVIYAVDSERGGEDLLNQRTGFVGPSRGRQDIAVYCDDFDRMVRDLSRDVSKRSAIEPDPPRLGVAHA